MFTSPHGNEPLGTILYSVEALILAMNVRGDIPLADIEQFLERATIPVRVACRTPRDELWMLSLWFVYRDGRLHCATAKSAAVVRYLEKDEHVAFEVSTNDPPYRGVRGNGTATITDDPDKTQLRELLTRYLGSTETPLGQRLLSEERVEVSIVIDPTRVYGWDFTERMRGRSEQSSA